MFQNLGIALGAGVDEYHRQQEESRKQTAESRADTQFKQQQEQYARQLKQQQAMDAVNAKYAGYREAMKKGDYSFADSLMNEYNSNQGGFADGLSVYQQSTPNGKVAHFVGQDGKAVRSVPINAQTMAQMLDDAHMAEMKYASPEMFQNAYYKDRTHGLDLRKVGVEEDKVQAVKGHYQDIANHYKWVEGQPQLRELGNGQVGMFQGEKYLGAYGPPRPILGHGGGSGAGGKTDWVPMGEDSDGQVVFFNKKAVVDPRNPDSMFLRPDGKPVADVRGLYRKLTGAAVDKPQPVIPKEAVTEFAKSYFNADPKTQQMLKLQNPVLTSLVTGGAATLVPGAKAGAQARGEPAEASIGTPYATRRGMNFVVVDPTTNRMEPIADYERRTGNAWADLPIR